eukprot:12080778-Heterocapsa_arctica.AAC.1
MPCHHFVLDRRSIGQYADSLAVRELSELRAASTNFTSRRQPSRPRDSSFDNGDLLQGFTDSITVRVDPAQIRQIVLTKL